MTRKNWPPERLFAEGHAEASAPDPHPAAGLVQESGLSEQGNVIALNSKVLTCRTMGTLRTPVFAVETEIIEAICSVQWRIETVSNGTGAQSY
jgi:hypothetical protein